MRMRLALRGEEPGGIREKALQSRAPEWAGWIATGGGLAVLAPGASSSAGFWFARSGRFNDRVERSARDISGLSDQVAREVAVAVTTMQFHDMVTQVIEHLKGRADLLSRLMSDLGSVSFDSPGPAGVEPAAGPDRRFKAFDIAVAKVSDMLDRVRHSPVSQMKLDAGSVDLF